MGVSRYVFTVGAECGSHELSSVEVCLAEWVNIIDAAADSREAAQTTVPTARLRGGFFPFFCWL